MNMQKPADARIGQARGAQAIWLVCAFSAIFAGVGLPFYLGLLDGNLLSLLVFPLGLFLLGIFFAAPKLFFYLIMVVRSACDLVFESARMATGGGGPGIGALVNASVIALALYIFSKDEFQKRKPMFMAWAIFFATAGYGLLLSPTKIESVRLILAWVSNLAVFFCAAHFVRSMKDFVGQLQVIVLSSIAPAVYAFYVIANAGIGSIGSLRIESTFTHPNIFAFYLAFVINIVFYLIKATSRTVNAWVRPALFLWMMVLLGLLVCTQTRSAWLACMLMFLGFGLLIERRYLLYMVGACALALTFEPIRDRLFDLNAPEVETSQTKLDSFRWRVELWTAGLGWMEIKRYFFGYGIGAFSENAPVFFPRGDGIKWDAHNVYVQWLFDVGIVGLLGYAWIHVRILYLYRRLAEIDRPLGFIVLVTVISYLTVSFSDNMMFYLAFNWYYWFFLGGAGALLFGVARTGTRPATGVMGQRPILLPRD